MYFSSYTLCTLAQNLPQVFVAKSYCEFDLDLGPIKPE